MTQMQRKIAATFVLALAAYLLTGCAAVRDFIAEAPIDLPQPSLPAAAEPFEKIYQGGSTPDGRRAEQWATKSERRIFAAAALHKVLVYSVDHEEGSYALTVKIKGDPADSQLIADVEQYVVPVALRWSPTVTVIIDPSLCGIVGEVKDESPLCDKLANR